MKTAIPQLDRAHSPKALSPGRLGEGVPPKTEAFLKALYSALTATALLLIPGCAKSPQAGSEPGRLPDGKSHFANLGGNKVHYVIEGKGSRSIVFVHCWAGNLEFWREQVPALTNHARLILIDLPGHGQSDKPHTAYTLDLFAGAVLAVMNDAHVDRATLVGHSMGVPVICQICRRAPERVAALVAVDGTLRRPKVTPEQAEQFIAPLRGADYREKAREFISTMFPVSGTEALRDRMISEMLETPQYVMVSAMEGMFGPDQPDWALEHLTIPLLVINAPNPMWTEDYQAYVRSLSPKVDYRTIEGVGHWLMLEKPAEFNALLVEMLRKSDLVGK